MFDAGGGVIVLPEASWSGRSDLIRTLRTAFDESDAPELQLVDLAIAENGAADQGVADLHEPIYAQQLCAALMSVHCPEPVTFVAYGPTCLALPPVALSMRSQHRRVRSYVLIDPHLPASSDTWPDCPVSVVYANSTDVSSVVRLSGWEWVVSHQPEDEVLRILRGA
ncbi:MAG: hypothetical protein GKR85_11420 [Candidatus Nanopelagicales bacterium]|mgnify:CR=1 FL=1|nr:hypothetical protein [Actinomycetes bacterium]NKB92858.1 hypothetical protein [Candidatus Nanopelagicales bacterium]